MRKRYSWRPNCTLPALIPHTRFGQCWEWSNPMPCFSQGTPPPPPFPPSKTLKFSCTCRTWRPCLKAARLSGSDPRSRGWLGAPSPEEHSRERRTLRGSRCCTGSAAVKGRWQKRWGLASTFPNTKTDSRSGTFSHRAVGGVCTA